MSMHLVLPDNPTLNMHISALRADDRCTAIVEIPAQVGRTADWPLWLDPRVLDAYRASGIPLPWQHQIEAADLAWSGRSVAIATGTASGKSVAFGMPGLTWALATPEGVGRGPTVLYLAPTKALAHDQLIGLKSLGLPLQASAVDGDTSVEERAWARQHARWIVSNPDMLHRTLLPGHEKWRGFFRQLRMVVVDEAHAYHGVFGSNVAVVLRRLQRVAELHGAIPIFVAASATSADPGLAATRLLGLRTEVVDVDTSARGPLTVALLRGHSPGEGESGQSAPSVEDPDDAVIGTLSAAAVLMGSLIDDDLPTLLFARSRTAVEVIAAKVREVAEDGDLVRAYRGGYLPEERRALEAALRDGRLRGIAATNALELGIDISGLDVVLLAGWPGTYASFWQQVGRAGRRGGAALAVLMASEDPLDHFIVDHPELLIDGPVESTVLDPTNPYVLAGHLCAAAVESFLGDEEVFERFGAQAPELCGLLAENGLLRRRRNGWYWTASSRATGLVDLRGQPDGPVRVIEDLTGRLLGTVDSHRAPSVVHDGAIYVHQMEKYQICELDLTHHLARAHPTRTTTTTQSRSTTRVDIQTIRYSHSWPGGVELTFGDVTVIRQVVSYVIKSWPGGNVVAQYPLDLPEQSLSTQALWWSLPSTLLEAAKLAVDEVAGSLHALEHAAIALLPLFATCDRWDLGGLSTERHPELGGAAIFVHDAHPGGAGFAENGFRAAREWLTATSTAIARCPCSQGCPRCVQSPKCGNGNKPLDKTGALRLVDAVLRAVD